MSTNSRAASLLILGAWIAGTLFMWTTATRNFAIVDQILAAPPDGVAFDRDLMRYQAGEVNRFFFNAWGWTQTVLSIVLIFVSWARRAWLRRIAVALAAITLFFQLYVVPQTIHLGRLLDFAPDGAFPTETSLFWTLHHTYTGLDMLKLLLLLACSWIVTRRFSNA